ncbi:MAG TPA: MFS transporter [Longimicrobium sp.]|nr:MFS transporter [Longimicrobium sp.]
MSSEASIHPTRRGFPAAGLVYLVSLAAFMGPFTQTVYTPILPDLERRFDTSVFIVNLTISLFTVVLAVMQIVYGPLTDRRGRRAVLLPGVLLYALASVGCAFSPTATLLLVGGGIFGVLLGLSLPVQTTILADAFVRDRATAIGVYNFGRYLGMAAGPMLGAVLFHAGGVPLLYGFAGVAFAAAALLSGWRMKGAPAHPHPEASSS